MGFDLGKTFADAAKRVSDSLGKTGKDITKAIDQNGDGKLDFSDIQVISNKIQADRAEAQRKADLEKLKPLFPDNFEGAEFVMPKMLRVAEIDKLHAENPVCEGSVGFKTVLDDMSAISGKTRVSLTYHSVKREHGASNLNQKACENIENGAPGRLPYSRTER